MVPGMVPHQVSGLSSMAMRGLLAELASAWGQPAAMAAAGGVDVAHRVRDGEVVDVVVLAAEAMHSLQAEGHLVPGSLVGIAVSAMAVAVRTDAPPPDLFTGEAMRRALLAAGCIGYSTGPSGDHLVRLLDRWGIRGLLGRRLVQAPPGVPAGRLLAEGTVDLAVQQRSELLGLPGIVIVGDVPRDVARDTVFTAGIARTARQPEAARGFIAFLASAQTSEAKRRHGMEPA